MRQHLRFVLLGSILLAGSLLVVFSPLASTASAATTSPASARQPTQLTRSVAFVLRSSQLAQEVQVSVTTSIIAASRDNAGDPCNTAQRQENGTDVFGIVLFWFKMQTSWCWDYRIVTSHTTRIYWGVTGPGAAAGWAFINHSPIHFHCYIAYGSTRDCSGNHEDATASFLNVVTLQTCLPFISEDENYRGQFFSSGHPC
jgi:hypothetical protein